MLSVLRASVIKKKKVKVLFFDRVGGHFEAAILKMAAETHAIFFGILLELLSLIHTPRNKDQTGKPDTHNKEHTITKIIRTKQQK